jgi:hypothetical protein
LIIVAAGIHLELDVRFFLLSILLAGICRWRLPRCLDGVVTIALIAAALLGVGDAYERIWWLDDVAHIHVTAILAGCATYVWKRRSARQLVKRAGLVADIAASSGTALACGLSFATAWELYEWSMVVTMDPVTLAISYSDTVMDIAQGGGGSWLAGILIGLHDHRRDRTLSAQGSLGR